MVIAWKVPKFGVLREVTSFLNSAHILWNRKLQQIEKKERIESGADAIVSTLIMASCRCNSPAKLKNSNWYFTIMCSPETKFASPDCSCASACKWPCERCCCCSLPAAVNVSLHVWRGHKSSCLWFAFCPVGMSFLLHLGVMITVGWWWNWKCLLFLFLICWVKTRHIPHFK